MSRRAVFLDRDGVLTAPVLVGGRERPAWSLDELHVVAAAGAATHDLSAAGFLLVLVTNQPDIARGDVDAEVVDAINERVAEQLGLDAVYTCPHDGHEGCACRKPLPGMVHEAADALDIDLTSSWLVGDRWVDIAAGQAAGVRTVLVKRPYSMSPTNAGDPPHDVVPDAAVHDIAEASALILRSAKP
jgi:D-glycero-D-manno-heptose 1,7-bisphosphate phosphatase